MKQHPSKKSDIAMVLLPLIVIFGFFLCLLLQKEKIYSDTERRVLAGLPKLTKESVLSGKYMTAFESYSLDQFPLRDSFRSLKAVTARYLLRKKDDHGYYMAEGYLSKLEFPMNEARMSQSIAKQQKLYDDYLKGTNCRIYQTVIPDKNYFLAEKHGYPAMDYEAYVERVKEGTPYAEYIDVFDTLSLEGFYYTDQHFRQECLAPLVSRLRERLDADFQTDFALDYTMYELDVPFYGAYKDQAALMAKADTIYYLTNDELVECTVTSYNTMEPKPAQLYDMDKAHGRDPYEMFLSGSDAFLVVENPNANTERELVLFRDSFGSSLAPLLLHGYSKITLIDLRYVSQALLPQLITFEDQDVLFAYSTLVF